MQLEDSGFLTLDDTRIEYSFLGPRPGGGPEPPSGVGGG